MNSVLGGWDMFANCHDMCLVPHFLQKILGFGPPFCKMELNTVQNFLAKRYQFSILDFGLKRPKKAKKNSHPPHKKFGILDGTKHTHKNFGILHFINPK
jgi:hypothetical protein